jgi:GT2 family glycosyltransferase
MVGPAASVSAGDPDVTVVMVPRERFSGTLASIRSLYEERDVPFVFICVDGGSPRPVQRRLAAEAQRRGFRVIRTEHYLTPNEARNLAIPEVRTKYIVFIDNDIVGVPGWLAALRRCAEETGADIVTPIVCIGKPMHSTVHFAGGDAAFAIENGQPVFWEQHHCYDRPLAEVRDGLVRGPTELAEFHCVLVRRQVFDRHGLLDENLKSINEHIDLCLTVRQGGGSVMFEPDAIITYVPKSRPGLGDLPYFFYRWSDELSLESEVHFHRKWGSVFNDDVTTGFVQPHRRRVWSSLRLGAQMVVGWHRSRALYDAAAGVFTRVGRRRSERALARDRVA